MALGVSVGNDKFSTLKALRKLSALLPYLSTFWARPSVFFHLQINYRRNFLESLDEGSAW